MGKRNYRQGKYIPRFPEKYKGDPENIFYRSGLERKYMNFFDLNSSILEWSYETDDIIIPYQDASSNNKIRNYYMDFYIKIKTTSGEIIKYLVEIKPAQQVKPKRFTKYYSKADYIKNLSKWKFAKKWAETNGMKFIILTEKNI